MLWRAQGKPAAEQETAFKDVSSDEYYAQAVAWPKRRVSHKRIAKDDSIRMLPVQERK